MIPDILRPLSVDVARTVVPDGDVEAFAPTGNPAHGDYQWNFAFRVAKALRTNPRALAEKLRPLLVHPAIAKVEVAGPGFLNVFLDEGWMVERLRAMLAEPALGVPQVGAGKTAIIDFSSPNVAKRMHIGHMRSTHIGHALDRLHRAAGYRVIADNHIGDWGTQFGKLIVAWRNWLDPAAYEEDPIGELERLYVRFGEKADEKLCTDEASRAAAIALQDAARAETVKLQQGDPQNTELWKQFMAVSMTEFNAIYERLGVRFDEVLGESAYRDMLPGIVETLLQKGIAEESQGAIIVPFTEPELNERILIRKKDGGFNYATSDIACVLYRMERWAPERIIYVVDTRQQLHFKQFFAIVRRLGVSDVTLHHAWFGMLVLPEGLSMSTRKGNVVRLVDLLDEAARRARAVVDQKAPELPEAERAAIAEAVGTNAIRYADLAQNPQTDVTFTWDRMLSLDGNTAPFLMYSHARAASLLAKAGEAPDLAALAISEPAERTLLAHLLRYPEAMVDALRTSRPNVLADYLFELANRFNRFYHDLPVLQSERRVPRLALVEASRRVLREGMERLGLKVIDRM